MKRNRGKVLIIVELLFLYFVLLTLLSHQRGPVRYRFDQNDNMLEQTELTIFSDPDGLSEISAGQVHALNPNGGVFGVSAPITLKGADVVKVQFLLNSSEAYAGREIHVDLMNYEGYDSDEQECVYSLRSGAQTFSCELAPGENAPNEAFFRVFCLEPVEFELSEIALYQGQTAAKVQPGHWIAVAAAVILLVITLFVRAIIWKDEENSEEKRPLSEDRPSKDHMD